MQSPLRVFAVVTVILAGLAIPANAAPSSADTLEAVVVRTVDQLRPFAEQRGVRFIVEAKGQTVISEAETELAKDRIVNLVANAVAMAPTGSTVNVLLGDDALRVWFENAAETWTVDRNVEDSTGNAFRIQSFAGRGTELSFSIDRPVVGSR